jgi:ABC-2 type transport system permease protein
VGAFAFLLGVISDTVTSGISENVQRQLAKIGAESVATPTGYLGFSFLFFVLAISLFCCWHVTAARRDESEGRLEALFALPVERRGWLAGRLLLAAASATAVALAAGLLAWAGAASQSADVSLPRMLEAGANCLPVGLLFLTLGFLALAALPRAASAATYGAVTLAFVWELFGSLLNAPGWLLGLSPFHHVGLVPAEPFEGEAAAIMLALAAVAALAAAWIFERRDLVEA